MQVKNKHFTVYPGSETQDVSNKASPTLLAAND